MAIQYGYNMPVPQTPYGYQQAPLQYYAPAPMWSGSYRGYPPDNYWR